MGDAADRRIAELEESERVLKANSKWLNDTIDDMSKTIASLRKQLVERDVYEAQQILPPEQAALIKHLATVERCIEEGPVSYRYAESSECQFCTEWQTGAHTRECAWLALQFDRKPEATMTMVHEHALNEHETWERRQKPSASGMTATMLNIMRENYYGPPNPEDLRRARLAVDTSREDLADSSRYGITVVTNPLVPLGAVYAMQPSTFVLPPEARPVAPNLGIGGEEPAEVAPPDDEDVP